MSTLFFRFVLLFISCQQSDDVLKVDLIENDAGWYYIIPLDSSLKTETAKTNIDGVCYINSDRYKNLKRIVVYKDGVDVTNAIRFLSKVDHDIFTDGTRKRYHLMKFYFSVNENSECCLEPKRNDPDTHSKYSRMEKLHRSRLIQEGKIRFK